MPAPQPRGGLPVGLALRQTKRTRNQASPTYADINQLVRKPRVIEGVKSKSPALKNSRRSAASARACTRPHPRSRTRAAQGGQSPPDQRLRGDFLHRGEGHNLQEIGGADPRRPRQGPARRALPHRARLARHAGVKDRKQSRSKYGAKRPKAA